MVPQEANTTTSAANSASKGVVNSPQRRQNLPSPWASVVRGDMEQIPSPTALASPPLPEQGSASETPVMDPELQPVSSDVNSDSNAGRPTNPAWNRPLNGVVESGLVMGGAVSWPALSESTQPVSRSLSDSIRPVSDRSVSSSQITANTNSHTHSAANNTVPARPRSRNRGGGGGGRSSGSGPSQTNFNRPTGPMPPPFPVFEVPMVPPMQDTPVRGPSPVTGIGGFRPHTGNDHSSQRNNPRSGNYGLRPRGDGQYHNNHGGRRDQVHLPPQYVPPPPPPMGGYVPPPLPHNAGPFVASPQMRVFPGQMGFDMPPPLFYVPAMHPDSFRAMPLVPAPPPMPFSPVNENPVTNMIVKQIDYYFSDENLDKDDFLKSHMDDHGWVPVPLIASFRRVQLLTKDISEILKALRYSTVVEIQGDKLRRRDDWHRWLKSSDSHNVDSGSCTPVAATENVLKNPMQQVSLNDSMANANGSMEASQGHTVTVTGKVLPEETTSHSRLANGEETAEDFH